MRAGFVERRATGGHCILRHPVTGRIASVPSHPEDLRTGTIAHILDQAGLTVEEFRALLRCAQDRLRRGRITCRRCPMTYTVVLWSEEVGGYSVQVPALPGCWTQGETVEEALDMAREAIGGYLAVLAEDGDPLPVEGDDLVLRLGAAREGIIRRVTVEPPVLSHA
jgi:predicted RNase H-like HicB family nuclease/predicted RNA binding protein YcfA (HicA-like mRNA interferase family)